MRVLVLGGTGYLGQFLARDLGRVGDDGRRQHDVAITYRSKAPSAEDLAALGSPSAFEVDLTTGKGLDACFDSFGEPEVVINCAAMSVPRDCEADPAAAAAVNLPTALLASLHARLQQPAPASATAPAAAAAAEDGAGEGGLRGEPGSSGAAPPRPCLFIHLSTDQVYSGQKANSTEDDKPEPVNAYGRTKVAAEQLLQSAWAQNHYAILRSSIIVGPQPPLPLRKGLPLLWMDQVLSSGKPTDFFADEFRCPIYVGDFTHIVQSLISQFDSLRQPQQQNPLQEGVAALGSPQEEQQRRLQLLLNAGGPDRLSRAGMAEVVAQVRRYAAATEADVAAGAVAGVGEAAAPTQETLPPLSTLVKRVSAATAVNRGVASPADISMDTSRIVSLLGISLTPFATAVRLTFQ